MTAVALVMGGPSAEHDVSLVSGRAIAESLRDRGHEVETWLIDLGGRWWSLPPGADDPGLPFDAYDEPDELGGSGPLSAAAALARLRSRAPAPTAFIALHGPFGEDGTVQALCESEGLAYTGSGVAASAVGMDKVLFKRLVGGMGMPLAPWRALDGQAFHTDPRRALEELADFAASLPDPRLVIKPAALGSSVGISIAHHPTDPEALGASLVEAFRHHRTAIAEAYVASARELEVSVLERLGGGVDVYGPGEVFPGNEFYDYRAKYEAGVSRTTAQPDLPEPIRDAVRRLAAQCFAAIGGAGFARVDFLLHGDRPLVSEINTIPGFTPISLFPVLCADGGLSFGETAERIVELARARLERRPAAHLTPADMPRTGRP